MEVYKNGAILYTTVIFIQSTFVILNFDYEKIVPLQRVFAAKI